MQASEVNSCHTRTEETQKNEPGQEWRAGIRADCRDRSLVEKEPRKRRWRASNSRSRAAIFLIYLILYILFFFDSYLLRSLLVGLWSLGRKNWLYSVSVSMVHHLLLLSSLRIPTQICIQGYTFLEVRDQAQLFEHFLRCILIVIWYHHNTRMRY